MTDCDMEFAMLDYIWGIMILIGVLFGIIKGPACMGIIGDGAISSAKEAVELCIVMLGVIGLWNGIMNIAKEAGLISRLTRVISPAISFLFPKIDKEDPVRQDIAMNIIANMLGLGWAATPAGLKAMRGLSRGSNIATDEMCTFLVINISSLQLLPVNIIAYRSEYNSADPTAIIGPALVATAISTIVAILYCKIKCRKLK